MKPEEDEFYYLSSNLKLHKVIDEQEKTLYYIYKELRKRIRERQNLEPICRKIIEKISKVGGDYEVYDRL